jgi:cellulose synthase operon protein C
LRKAPAHPVLNYHLGKMIASDRSRAGTAKSHLKQALAAGDRLTPSMAQEAVRLVQQLDRQGVTR